MARRYYSSTAVETTLSGSISNSATSITVTALSGFPNTTPWTAILDADTASEELVEVTNVAGTTLTVTRGVDGTAAVSHNAGASFRHGVSARDFDEANSHVNASSGVHGLTGSVVGTSDTQTLTNKTISGASNTISNIAQSSVTNLTTDLGNKANAANPTFTGVASFPDGSASAPSITNTGDTDTGFFHPAADTVAISTGGTERVRVNASGQVGIGVSPGTDFDIQRSSQLTSRWRSAVDSNRGSLLYFDKARGSWSAPTTVQNGDNTLEVFSRAHDGTQVRDIGAIQVVVDGVVATNDVPSRLTFSTRPAGVAAAVTERMRIDPNGLITGTGTSLGAWTTYTPTLGGTGWAIGNGTASGFYCQIGKVMFVRVNIVFGGTSTFGAGGLTCSLPANANGSFPAASAGLVRYTDTSASAIYLGAGGISSNVFAFQSITSATGQVAALVSSAPFTWADTDIIRLSMAYEIA